MLYEINNPILIRDQEGRGAGAHKAYGAVIICLVTRAIYLEFVTHLNTLSFIAAFDIYSSCRGRPYFVKSDNRKNFVGANAELHRAFVTATKDENLRNSLAQRKIKWQFIPPVSPHFGGM